MSMNVAEVTGILRNIQKRLDLTDAEFSGKLGISRQLWNFVKTGARAPGLKLLKSAMREFPETTIAVMRYMSEEVVEDM